jgi:hypothetical protein
MAEIYAECISAELIYSYSPPDSIEIETIDGWAFYLNLNSPLLAARMNSNKQKINILLS